MVDKRVLNVHSDRRNTGKDGKELNKQKILEWTLRKGKPPTIAEVMDITGYSYDWAAVVRREVLREMPKLDMEELGEEIKNLILKRVNDESIDNTNLVRLLEFFEPKQSTAQLDVNLSTGQPLDEAWERLTEEERNTVIEAASKLISEAGGEEES